MPGVRHGYKILNWSFYYSACIVESKSLVPFIVRKRPQKRSNGPEDRKPKKKEPESARHFGFEIHVWDSCRGDEARSKNEDHTYENEDEAECRKLPVLVTGL